MSQPEPTDAAVSEGAKPCPFCGGEKFEISGGEDDEIYLRCMTDGCGCVFLCGYLQGMTDEADQDDYGMTKEDRQQAYDAWDQRVTDQVAFREGAKWGAVEALKITHKPHEIQAFGGSFEWLSIEEQADRILADPLKRLAKGE